MDKNPIKSKTMWAAALLVVYAGAKYLGGVDLPLDSELVYTILGALGLYGLRDAIGKKK